MLTQAGSSTTEYVSGLAQQTGWGVTSAGGLDRTLETTVAARYTHHIHINVIIL